MKATRICLGVLGGILFVYYGLPLLNFFLFVTPYLQEMPVWLQESLFKGLPKMYALMSIGIAMVLVSLLWSELFPPAIG